MAMKMKHTHWIGLGITLAALIGLSYLLAALLGKYANLDITQYDIAWLVYLAIFGISLVSNLTIVAPVPFALAIMVAASTKWNPAIIGLMGAAGGAIGELSGYYAGALGRKIAISENIPGYHRIHHWIQKYGMWAIFLFALQPVIPFDVGGLVAGATKMPLGKFLPANFAGKLIKYLVIVYGGAMLLKSFPGFPQ